MMRIRTYFSFLTVSGLLVFGQLLFGLFGGIPLMAEKSPSNPGVKIACGKPAGTCTLRWRDGTEVGPLAGSVELVDGTRLVTTDMPKHQVTKRKASPAGLAEDGTEEWVIRHFGKSGAPELVQHIYLPSGEPYALIEIEAVDKNPLSSRKMSPVALAAGGSARLAVQTRPTVLFVPNDNDMWVHYNEPIDPAKDPDSYEVTAVFDNASRKGLVLGSVTHDLWRTGVLARGLETGKVGTLEIYGGATGHWTHDVDPHGVVTATTLRSPLVMVGYFSDWRDGLETYGKVNARIHPPLAWPSGVPFGWNSWAAYLQKITPERYQAAADFIHTELMPRGFINDKTTYVNFDAGWNDLTVEQMIAAAKHVHDQGQKAGIYFTPFSYWQDDFAKPVEGTNGKYTYGDLLLRDAKGNPLPKIDGARPLDPTHPGTIARIDYHFSRFVEWGYDSVKLDFLNCGSMEGHHYDPAITTGVAAYAYGMQRIEDDVDPKKIGRPFFLSLSIAPLFPAYGHSRRVSCDAFGRIEDSDYLLNASTFGWWTNQTLYRFNDPDHTVISLDTDPYHGSSPKGSVQTLEEARSRVNASVITGTLLLDSDDLMDARAQARAKELLTNKAVLEVARSGRAFRPVEGDSGEHSSKIFTLSEPDGSMYVAVFNFSQTESSEMKIDLSRLGLSASQEFKATDLWKGTSSEVKGLLSVSLSQAQSTILHIAKR